MKSETRTDKVFLAKPLAIVVEKRVAGRRLVDDKDYIGRAHQS